MFVKTVKTIEAGNLCSIQANLHIQEKTSPIMGRTDTKDSQQSGGQYPLIMSSSMYANIFGIQLKQLTQEL